MVVQINNIGESTARITKEITEEQYAFLKEVFSELNESASTYAPRIYMVRK